MTVWIGWLLSLIVPCFVSAGLVLLAFLWARNLRSGIRQLLAAIGGPLVVVGPGMASNVLDGGQTPDFYLIYFGLYLVGSVPTAILLTRQIDRRFAPIAGAFQ